MSASREKILQGPGEDVCNPQAHADRGKILPERCRQE
jgi:hypothetical protein